MKCQKCQIKFPDKFYSPLHTSEGTFKLCPECALNEVIRIHRLPKEYKFLGEYAQELYNEFIEWKEKKQCHTTSERN